MTTETTSLAAWLLEQIEADEAVARAAVGAEGGAWSVAHLPAPTYDHVLNWGPNRVLAQCKALRAIVEYYEDDGFPLALRALATVYADRPGFEEAWRV